jgi:hypothetical protein
MSDDARATYLRGLRDRLRAIRDGEAPPPSPPVAAPTFRQAAPAAPPPPVSEVVPTLVHPREEDPFGELVEAARDLAPDALSILVQIARRIVAAQKR